MNIKDKINEFLKSKSIENYSKNTLDNYGFTLKMWQEYLVKRKVKKITKQTIKDFVEKNICVNRKPSSIKTLFSELTSFLKYCNMDKLIPDFNIKVQETTSPEVLTDEEIDKIRNNITNNRDLLIFDVLCNTGLRISELCNIKMSDINNSELTVVGKGNKKRTVFLVPELYQKIQAQNKGVYLFPGYKNKPITRALVNNKLHEYGKLIGKRVYPHLLRHSFASKLYRKSNNLLLVQNILGHSSVQTTQRYVHLVDNKNEFFKYWR